MAISPFRVSILRGVNAMASGVKNPYGTPKLGAAPTGGSKRKQVELGSSVPKAPRIIPMLPKPTGNNPKTDMPKLGGTGDGKTIINEGAIRYGGETNAKTSAAQNTAVGKKTYGISGRNAPNIGPTSAAGSVGYKQRDMRQAAAKAALTNIRQKKGL